MKRCISCKQEIIGFGERRLEGFHIDIPPKSFGTSTDFILWDQDRREEIRGAAYPYWAEGEDGCFWHLTLRRGFKNGRILLRIGEVFTSYLKHPWDVAHCTHQTLTNGSYSRLLTIPSKAQVASPWLEAENDRDSLLRGLDQLGGWFDQHREEIAESCRKQQGWVDKEQGRSHRVTRLYLRDHWQEAGQKEVLALYREVDRLAREYEAAKKQGEIRYGADHSFFSDWCVGKLPAPFDRWEEELAAIFQTKKARVVNDPAYAHAFAVSNLLYFIHDLEKDLCPDILIGKRWKE
ncbi:MAG: hypothetical protein HFF11_05000 [Angelakisella sp.]|jgi:hypothetical protein|nr:hypothetical protein [Angelakisella sp.]